MEEDQEHSLVLQHLALQLQESQVHESQEHPSESQKIQNHKAPGLIASQTLTKLKSVPLLRIIHAAIPKRIHFRKSDLKRKSVFHSMKSNNLENLTKLIVTENLKSNRSSGKTLATSFRWLVHLRSLLCLSFQIQTRFRLSLAAPASVSKRN